MREILGRRRRLRRKEGAARLDAALTFATRWRWPVLPGAGTAPAALRDGRGLGCACPDPDCAVPGAHPFDPGLLAATTDERMVRWWWTNRPTAPVMLATGGRAPCAVSLPALAGARALTALDLMGMRLGPVVATPTRWSLLVAPYTLERLGELLYSKDWVPSSLRFHGEGGYLVLPPSEIGAGQVRWERAPRPAAPADSAVPSPVFPVFRRAARGGGAPAEAAPWLPDVEAVLDALVEASTSAPDGGSRLAY
ncbi:bifunctional DNA primase/polymerase [Streptomyces griseus]|uniref:Bifunctional DNA primase/polymerase n=1 Tax=Streptomyces stephensoniae TaxID=3375367 RepID=A0ABU2VVU0_9ACTN|nr:bifunctional DNA primase/polymerase [Streptomyces griseus]MDT0489370.1 bifunctional DNA primase/polymerase [Streptomyces griseus]